MKTKRYILLLLAIIGFQFCIAQDTQTNLPKIENYTKGELELKIESFGEENPVKVGKIMADGTIHFNWLEADLSKVSEDNYMTKSIENFYGGKFCRNSGAVISKGNATLVETKLIYVFKYGKLVGCIVPSTQKNHEYNKDQLGSTIYWIYSNSDVSVKANCSEKIAWKDLYSFNQTIAYDIDFKKGFNIVSNTLEEVETWDNGEEKGSLPKTRIIKSVDQIPENIYWQLKYWANDELLEIEYQLLKKAPITKTQYKNWAPKKLGKLKRTSYNIGKTLERIPTLNNIELHFEKGSKIATVTIVDCVKNKKAASVYTLMLDMASRDWKDKTKTGYSSASNIDGTRVMIGYNEIEAKTTLNYNANGRFMVKAEATNMNPESLWDYLKTLNLNLLKDK